MSSNLPETKNNTLEKILFVVATPIGNLQDITIRAVNTLKEAQIVFAENPETTRKLFSACGISSRLIKYNDHQPGLETRLAGIFSEINIAALVSEAGTPCISDPGYKIVNYCHENEIKVIPCPGPSAAAALLSVCGFPLHNYRFCGFLSNKKIKRENQLTALMANEKTTLVFYESPYRLRHFLEILAKIKENARLAVGREISKKFEEIIRGDVNKIRKIFENKEVKGEFTLIIDNN